MTNELVSSSKQRVSRRYFWTVNSDEMKRYPKIVSMFFSTNSWISLSSLKGSFETSLRTRSFVLNSFISFLGEPNLQPSFHQRSGEIRVFSSEMVNQGFFRWIIR